MFRSNGSERSFMKSRPLGSDALKPADDLAELFLKTTR
jgi:hypothetical protein